jgi:CheY-like chemotaxis protein
MSRRSISQRDPAGPLAGVRALVVDDHTFTIGLIKDMLYAGGALAVHSARDGAQALKALKEYHPHVIITDWRMPAMDGVALTAAIRRAAIEPDPRVPNPQVPIVLVSAHASARAVEEARKAGVTEVVAKPFALTALLDRVLAALTKPRAFVVAGNYVGPDRRRRPADVAGWMRRASDNPDPADLEERALRRLQAQLDAIELRSAGRRNRAIKAAAQ